MKHLFFLAFCALLLPQTVTAQTVNEVDYSPQQTTFSLFAPSSAKKVKLRIYQDGELGKAKALQTVLMKRKAKPKDGA